MAKVKLPQLLMILGWLVILVLTVNAAVSDLPGVMLIFNNPWSALVTTDLVVELLLIAVFIHWDATRRGKNPWGWIIVALVLGALSTLLYFLVRHFDKDAPPLFPRSDRAKIS
jgi:Terpene cyclase DEP1